MKISIRASLRSIQGTDAHPLKWALDEGSKLGFDGLEFCMEAGAMVASWTQESVEQIKTFCKQYKMSIYSLSSDWAWAHANSFPSLGEWGQGIELIANDAKLAKELGAHTILMHFATSKGSWDDCKILVVFSEERRPIFIQISAITGRLQYVDDTYCVIFGK